jgi:hypothetical protein
MNLKLFKFLIFDSESLEEIKKIDIRIIPFLFFLIVIIHSLPSHPKDNILVVFVTNVIITSIALSATLLFLYFVALSLKSKTKIKDYISSITVILSVITIISIFLSILLLKIGEITGTYDLLLSVVQGSLFLYYFFIVFGWASEQLANFSNIKNAELREIIFGLVSISSIYLYHSFLFLLA